MKRGDLAKLLCDETFHDPGWIPGDPRDPARALPRGELVTIVEPPSRPWLSALVLHPAQGLGRVFGPSLEAL